MVGKRVEVLWNQNKKKYTGTIIGYNTSGTQNLIYFDERTKNALYKSCDYYTVNLFGKSSTSKWWLLEN